MRIGAKLPNNGPQPLAVGIPEMARVLEGAGYDSLWVSDHIVLPEEMRSPYPFAADGRPNWASTMPYFDAVIALSLAAAVTERVRLGTAVLVLPLRNPVELAKQAASISVASGGRLQLGLGAGWLAEEFEALNVPFEGRGRRMLDYIEVMRECWRGTTDELRLDSYTLPRGTQSWPAPEKSPALLIGGHSPVALRRAGRVGDGWLAQQSALALNPRAVAAEILTVAEAATKAGRSGPSNIVMRIVDSLGRPEVVAAQLAEFEQAGVDEVIVDVPVDEEGSRRALNVLKDGVA